MWSNLVQGVGESAPTTEWTFDIGGYVWVGDMLVHEEDLAEWNEVEADLMAM